MCASNDTNFTSDGSVNTFRVMFKEPVEVLPNTNYTAYATLKVSLVSKYTCTKIHFFGLMFLTSTNWFFLSLQMYVMDYISLSFIPCLFACIERWNLVEWKMRYTPLLTGQHISEDYRQLIQPIHAKWLLIMSRQTEPNASWLAPIPCTVKPALSCSLVWLQLQSLRRCRE